MPQLRTRQRQQTAQKSFIVRIRALYTGCLGKLRETIAGFNGKRRVV